MAHIEKVKYFTKDKLDLISESNKKKYEKYLKSSTIKSPDTKETTYNTYQNNFQQFLVFLAEKYDNIDLYSDEFMTDAVDIMEDYIAFCEDTLKNHKKTINNKIAAVSSFYIWSMKRGLIKSHPFYKKLDRMKKANEEHIINSYFLTEDQVIKIRRTLSEDTKHFDIRDQILFEVAYDSCNRVGALERLTLTSLNLDNMVFENIREKEGYIVEVSFQDHAKELIEEWLEMRKDGWDHLECDAFLIVKWRGEWRPMKRDAIRTRMTKIGEIVGIPDFHIHCTRKSSINNIYNETGDLTLASGMANHKGTDVTVASYIKPKSKTELREKINKLKERNEKLDAEKKLKEKELEDKEVESSD